MFIDNLKKLAFWSKFMGVCTIIYGAISAIIGVFAFIIGAIPGVVFIFLGVKLCQASNKARTLAYSISDDELDKRTLSDMVEQYMGFFRITGIYTIVAFVLVLLSIVVLIVFGLSSFNHFSNGFSMINSLIG